MKLKKTQAVGFVGAIVLTSVVLNQHPFAKAQIMIIEPAARIIVHQEGGRVSFEFQREEQPGSMKMVPAAAVTFGIKRHGGTQTLWYVVSPSGHTASKIIYGMVPEGFTQYVPEKGDPPPLDTGKEYDVSANVGGFGVATFIYRGP